MFECVTAQFRHNWWKIIVRIARIIEMGKKKYNICSKCEFRHAAPTGKACLAGAGKQAEELPKEDEIIQRGPASYIRHYAIHMLINDTYYHQLL